VTYDVNLSRFKRQT